MQQAQLDHDLTTIPGAAALFKLLRLIANAWSAVGGLLLIAAILATTAKLFSQGPQLSYLLIAPAAILGMVLLYIGKRASQAAVGAEMKSKRASIHKGIQSDRADSAPPGQGNEQVWAVLDDLLTQHEKTLRAKRAELVYKDDYSKRITGKWEAEITYFWQRIAKPALTSRCSAASYKAALEKAINAHPDPTIRREPEKAMAHALYERLEQRILAGPSAPPPEQKTND